MSGVDSPGEEVEAPSGALATRYRPPVVQPTPSAVQARRSQRTKGFPGGLSSGHLAGWLTDLGVALAYLALAALAYLPAWRAGPGRALLPGADPIEEVWFLGTVAHHLLEGHLPLHAASVNAPEGANLLANTSMPLLGLLSLPLVTTVGPVVAYNTLMTLAFPVSAFSAYLVFRRWVSSRPARAIGGLVFGFAPYMTAEGLGHVFLTWVPLLPVLLLLTDEVLVRQTWPAGWTGLGLGIVAALQYFISAEILATAVVMGVGAAVLLALCWPRATIGHLRHAARGALSATVSFLVLAGYPIWYQLRGPEALHVPAQTPTYVAILSSDLFSALIPTPVERFGPAALKAIGARLVASNVAEVGSYVGIGLAVLLVWIVARAHRDAVTRIAALLAFAAYVLSMGPRLRLLGVTTKIDLPEAALYHLPLYNQIVPGRLAVYMWLFVALVLARWLGGGGMRLAQTDDPSGPEGKTTLQGSRRRLILTGRYSVAAITLVALVPAWPYPSRSLDLPRFFTTSAVDSIPVKSDVLTYPWVDPFHDAGLLWVAEAHFRFRVPGGYLALPNPRGSVAQLAPHGTSATATLLNAVRAGEKPTLTPALRCRIEGDLQRWRIDAVVVSAAASHAQSAVAVLRSLLGSPSRTSEGVVLWRDPEVRTAGARSCRSS